MAKPKKKSEPATSTMTIRLDLTTAERQRIERAAKHAGMGVDAFVKSLIVPLPAAQPTQTDEEKAEEDAWLDLARRASNHWAEENPY